LSVIGCAVPTSGLPGADATVTGGAGTDALFMGRVLLANPGTPQGAPAYPGGPALGKAPPATDGYALPTVGELYPPFTMLLAANGTNPAIPGPDV